MRIFLSYAGADRTKATLISERLTEAGHAIFNWSDPERRGKRFMTEIAKGIKAADAFVALLSPGFEDSYWCQREQEMAIQRDRAIQAADPDAVFINVVSLGGVAPSDAGMLGVYDWIDMSNQGKSDEGLLELARRFPSEPSSAGVATTEWTVTATDAADPEPLFRNRDEELHRVINGLTNPAGPHFWLVAAPPQLGKTWLLWNIRTHDTLARPDPWTVELVDLRDQPAALISDADAVLTLMFGNMVRPASGNKALEIAKEIIKTKRPYLCLLDGGELLSERTAGRVREYLDQIYHYIQDSGSNIRLGFIVASRMDDGWKGVKPLRLTPLMLTQFNAEIVQQALRDLAAETDRPSSMPGLKQNADRVFRVTEGLPALLARYLQWIKAEEWLDLQRLEGQKLFEKLAGPYIRREVFTSASLLPADLENAEARLQAIVEAYRVLVPYRLFTQSHVRRHLESDARFRNALSAADWTVVDLWSAIRKTALLLRRPHPEPWSEIHPAIRRLLFRHFYRSTKQRVNAHHEAGTFVQIWADKQVGTEQVIGLVECLWHEASALTLGTPTDVATGLTESVRKLSGTLRPSGAFTVDELRQFAADRMRSDEELEEVVSNGDGLLSQLIEVALSPGEL